MASLLDCHSQEDYMQLCNLLIAHENQKVQDWARHKKDIIIASGLNKHCSLIPEHIYERLRKHTNAAEKTHNKSYAFGKHDSWKLDKRDILQYYAREDYGVCHSYQSSNIESLYHRHIQREESVQRRRSYSQFRASTEDVVDIDTRSQASTISAGSSLGNLDSISQRSPRPARRARSSQVPLRQQASQNILSQTTEQKSVDFQARKEQLELDLMAEQLKERQLMNKEREIALQEREVELARKKQCLGL
ncbi:hypothetical protein CIHG_10581 [Coccidioides immitis H538.4]|uniref:Uncharacterized protein n=1 Tax=Coccidioides immitis H538.4 TaxID=396776 RepID=A0A0P6Q398_COCIT|nr:hypothetical protein CIHG_10581 [Coccidioides immitis H538.4]